MDFTVKIDDALFEGPVKDAVGRAVHNVVRERVNLHISVYHRMIDEAVTVYLNKRLTDVDVKAEIDLAVKHIIEEKLREEEGRF